MTQNITEVLSRPISWTNGLNCPAVQCQLKLFADGTKIRERKETRSVCLANKESELPLVFRWRWHKSDIRLLCSRDPLFCMNIVRGILFFLSPSYSFQHTCRVFVLKWIWRMCTCTSINIDRCILTVKVEGFESAPSESTLAHINLPLHSIREGVPT